MTLHRGEKHMRYTPCYISVLFSSKNDKNYLCVTNNLVQCFFFTFNKALKAVCFGHYLRTPYYLRTQDAMKYVLTFTVRIRSNIFDRMNKINYDSPNIFIMLYLSHEIWRTMTSRWSTWITIKKFAESS